MNSTTQDLKDFMAAEEAKERDPVWFKNYSDQVEDKNKRELALIERGSSACPHYRSEKFEFNEEDFRKNLSSLDFGKVKELVSKQFYNEDVMIGASCATDAMFYSIPNKQGSSSVCEVVREEVDKLKVVAAGVQGQGGPGDVSGTKGLFWYKLPRHGFEADLTHELFVGLMGTNLLRDECYNFAFVYGGFRMRRPSIGPGGDIVTLCPAPGEQKDSATSVPFLMMENLAGSVSLANYFPQMDVLKMLSFYFQILFALNLANRRIGFTHYDLHTENVMLRDISDSGFGKEFLIPYTFEGRRLYVRTTKVATIIDYGMAGIKYQDTYYGTPSVYEHRGAMFNDKPWPLHDAYKLLMFMLQASIIQNKPDVEAALTKIFRFFNKTEDPRLVTTNAKRDINGRISYDVYGSQFDPARFALPYNDSTSKYTMKDLIYFVLEEFPRVGIVLTQPPKGYNVLECTSCMSFGQVARIIGAAEPIPKPQTFFHLYDAAMLESRLGKDTFKQMVASFNYTPARAEFVKKINSLVTEAREITSSASHVDLQINNVFDPVSLLNIRRNNEQIYRLTDVLERLNSNIGIGRWVGSLFNDMELISMLDKTLVESTRYQPILCELVTRASNNYVIIYNAMLTPAWKDNYSRDPTYVWYAESAGDITSLQNRACVSPAITQPIKLDMSLPPAPRTFVPEPFYINRGEIESRANSPRSEFFRQRPDQIEQNIQFDEMELPRASSSNIFGL